MADVLASLAACRICDSVQPPPVVGVVCGPTPARVMLVGEAPGRRGAARTGIPFEGDESGRRLERFVGVARLDRKELYITNAVLCLPRDTRGNNRTPGALEIRACAANLRRQIEIVDPTVVATLGRTALRSAFLIEPHDISLPAAAGAAVAWFARWLVPMYHPARQATLHRDQAKQMADWQRLGAWLREESLVPDPAHR